MAILILKHDPMDKPSCLGNTLRDHGHKLDIRRLHEGDSLPVDLDDIDGLVILGGPMNVDQEADYPWLTAEKELIKKAYDAELPMVGLCLGAQLIAEALGGEVGPMENGIEAGFENVKLAFPGTVDPIMAGIPWDSMQFHAHGYEVTQLPPGATPLAGSQKCRQQAFCIGSPAYVYAFQYHFEWTKEDIRNWLAGSADWLKEHDVDAAAIEASLADYYDLYRHLGDRLCKRLTDLLFPLDRRLSHKSGVLTSYDPAVS